MAWSRKQSNRLIKSKAFNYAAYVGIGPKVSIRFLHEGVYLVMMGIFIDFRGDARGTIKLVFKDAKQMRAGTGALIWNTRDASFEEQEKFEM